MFREGNSLSERSKDEISSSEFPEESLGLEKEFWETMEANCTIERYIDKYGIEHVRCFHNLTDTQDDNCWEVLYYDEDQSPLEFLTEIE